MTFRKASRGQQLMIIHKSIYSANLFTFCINIPYLSHYINAFNSVKALPYRKTCLNLEFYKRSLLAGKLGGAITLRMRTRHYSSSVSNYQVGFFFTEFILIVCTFIGQWFDLFSHLVYILLLDAAFAAF